MKKLASFRTRLVACALSVGSLLPAGASMAGESPADLALYEDSRFDFSLQYFKDWSLKPRTEAPGALSEVLEFTGPKLGGDTHAYIAIGHYLEAIPPSEGLRQWGDEQGAAFDPSEIQTFARTPRLVAGREAEYVSGKSPLTEYQYVNVRQGETVWFVWANFGVSAPAELNAVFESMVASLKFGERMPMTLWEIYGESLLPKYEPLPSVNIGADWWSPVKKNGTASWAVNCGSSYHTQGASYAADIAATLGWNARASKSGTVEKSGWDTTGYGNLVKINTTYRHLYGHLDSIYSNITVGSSVTQDTPVGIVGGTGGVPVHLHFHVQNGQYQSSSSGVDLRGMYGFTANSYYPSAYATCGSMGR